MPLISDHFLASLMVMFRILSLISCHFKAWGFFHCLQRNCSARQSPLHHLFSKWSPQPFFLIQRPCSSCCTTRVLLTTSIFLSNFTSFTSNFLSIPLDGCVKFKRNVTSVIIDSSEVQAFKLDLLSELSAPSLDLA